MTWKIKAPSHGTCIAYLALFMAMGGTAAAATGGTFLLGRSNAASSQTALTNSGSTPVLALSARAGQVPLAVSAGAGKATNLNADKLDGFDSSNFLRQGAAVDATTLGGAGPSTFQRRISGTCGAGQAVQAIGADGAVICVNVDPAPVQTSAPVSRDKGFAISNVQISKDGAGNWTAVSRITNETPNTRSGNFTITVFRDQSIVATLRGTVSGLASQTTNTVSFFSSDSYSEGTYTTSFQTDVASDG